MPAELVLRLTGGVQNADPGKSHGGATSAWPVDLSALFGEASPRECDRGATHYRALDLLNVGDQGSRRGRAWVAPAAALALGLSRVADVGSWFSDGVSPPWDHGAFVSFGEYGEPAPLQLPDLEQGGALRLWLRRTIPPRSTGGLVSAALRISYL